MSETPTWQHLGESLGCGDQSKSPGSALSLEAEWLDSISKSVLTAPELRSKEMPPRENIIGEWFKQGDLGFLFAPRGVGKTWLGLRFWSWIIFPASSPG